MNGRGAVQDPMSTETHPSWAKAMLSRRSVSQKQEHQKWIQVHIARDLRKTLRKASNYYADSIS